MTAWMNRVRRAPPQEIADLRVTSVRDLAAADPPADVLVLFCGDTARITLRPSGTEPKAKGYIETVAHAGQSSPDPSDIQRSLAALIGQP